MPEGINKLDQKQLSTLLDNDALDNVVLPSYNRNDVGIGIVHLGLGAFHRSHQAMFTEQLLNEQGASNWGICGVSFRNETLQSQLQSQDCLYTSATLDIENSFQVVGALKEVLVVKSDLTKVLNRMAAPLTKIVSLTVTEKGYCLTSDGLLDLTLPNIINDLANIEKPTTAIGLLVASLDMRFQSGVASFNVIACDNLPNNGEKLKSAVLQFAGKVSIELAKWIDVNTHFPNTMVDCITPQTETATVELVEQTLGVTDHAPVQREHFSQWVIESSHFDRPAWEEVGVIFTDNVEVFENAKLRILNGLHSALAYIGILRGYDTVFEAISDHEIKSFLVNMLDNEIIPTLKTVEGLDLIQYSRDIMARFENPKIRHLLRQIACDGSIKIPVRTLSPLIENINAERGISALSIVVASWLHFIKDSVINNIDLQDPRANDLANAFEQQIQKNSEEVFNVRAFINLPGLMPDSLIDNDTFLDSVTKAYNESRGFFYK